MFGYLKIPALVLTLAGGGIAAPVLAAEEFDGPVHAVVTRVVDGDTLEVRAQIWLGLEMTSKVRIRGIDAPELESACVAERAMAGQACDRLTELVGGSVQLQNITEDKYAGRVDADAVNAAGTDLKTAMIAARLARPYDGHARGDWCPVGSIAR